MKSIVVVLFVVGFFIGLVLGFSIFNCGECPKCEVLHEANQTNDADCTDYNDLIDQLAISCANARTFYYPGAMAIGHGAGEECYAFMGLLVDNSNYEACDVFDGKEKAICVGSSLSALHYSDYCEPLGEYEDICLINLANRVVFRTNTPLSEIEQFCLEFDDALYENECLYLIEYKEDGSVHETNRTSFGLNGWGYYGNFPGYPFS
ncbi:MAG: hypothetical protein ABH864_03830 [archaeon]